MSPEQATRLVTLDRAECLRLLASTTLGRLAINAPGWPPMIRPVNYAFDERSQSVVFRSGAGSKLTALLHAERVAFEIDGADPVHRLGWSVIVVGPVEAVTNPAERNRLERSGPQPWVTAERAHLQRIRVTVVSGRQLQRSA
jgi:uncharacterized protein